MYSSSLCLLLWNLKYCWPCHSPQHQIGLACKWRIWIMQSTSHLLLTASTSFSDFLISPNFKQYQPSPIKKSNQYYSQVHSAVNLRTSNLQLDVLFIYLFQIFRQSAACLLCSCEARLNHLSHRLSDGETATIGQHSLSADIHFGLKIPTTVIL